MKSLKSYYVLLGLLFVGYVLVEYFRPKPVDWKPTLENKDKIPYGTYVLYEMLPGFMNADVKTIRQPIYNQLITDNSAERNYIFISSNFHAGKQDMEQLLSFVNRGGVVFIAAENFGDLADTLNFSTGSTNFSLDTVTIDLIGQRQKAENKAKLHATAAAVYFKADSLLVADTLATNNKKQPIMLRLPYGKGRFYIHSAPMLFSNYYLLRRQQNADAAAFLLSYMPPQLTFWDEYLKQGRVGNTSIFRVIVSYEALRWAYYIALAGLILFLIFESKRRQRIIPVIEPPVNTTLQFTEAVAALYYKSNNHKILADKKIMYLMEFLRQHLNISTNLPDDELKEILALKTSLTKAELNDLFNMLAIVRNSADLTERDLHHLNEAIEAVYSRIRPEVSAKNNI